MCKGLTFGKRQHSLKGSSWSFWLSRDGQEESTWEMESAEWIELSALENPPFFSGWIFPAWRGDKNCSRGIWATPPLEVTPLKKKAWVYYAAASLHSTKKWWQESRACGEMSKEGRRTGIILILSQQVTALSKLKDQAQNTHILYLKGFRSPPLIS